MRVVVVIPTREASPEFDAADWEYLKRGVILQDAEAFGLLHLEELDEDSRRVDAV